MFIPIEHIRDCAPHGATHYHCVITNIKFDFYYYRIVNRVVYFWNHDEWVITYKDVDFLSSLY